MNVWLWLAVAFVAVAIIVPCVIKWQDAHAHVNPDDYTAVSAALISFALAMSIAIVLGAIGAGVKWL